MKSTRKKLPNLYYFNTNEDFDVNDIEGDSIVFVRVNPSEDQTTPKKSRHRINSTHKYKTFPMTAYFIKDKQYVLDGNAEVKKVPLVLNQSQLLSLRDKREADGSVALPDEHFEGIPRLQECVKNLARMQSFPYTHVTMYFARDGKSVELTTLGGGRVLENDNIHPILKEYLQNQHEPSYDLLTLLYKIKACRDFEQSAALYQKKGVSMGFALTKSSHKIDITDMISLVHKANKKKYMSFTEFKKKSERITNKFANSSLTPSKKAIFDDFEIYYNANRHNPDYMPRSVLIETWARAYADNNENPFTILNEQRRTDWRSFFHKPKITQSTQLFVDFLGGENIPPSLSDLMQEKSAVEVQLHL